MTTMGYLHCPLRGEGCEWRTVDRSHLGTVVLVDGQEESGQPRLVHRDARLAMQDELRGHLAQTHRRELQLMLAGIDGGRGEPVDVSLTQHVARKALHGVEDIVLDRLVTSMRARLAADLTREGLRPLDPWPALTVRRFVWAQPGPMNGDGEAPSGMREARDGEQPDLYQLELRTEAVQDTRSVTL